MNQTLFFLTFFIFLLVLFPSSFAAGESQCNDKFDNDGDGLCDYIGCYIDGQKYDPDPGCEFYYDDNEGDEVVEEEVIETEEIVEEIQEPTPEEEKEEVVNKETIPEEEISSEEIDEVDDEGEQSFFSKYIALFLFLIILFLIIQNIKKAIKGESAPLIDKQKISEWNSLEKIKYKLIFYKEKIKNKLSKEKKEEPQKLSTDYPELQLYRNKIKTIDQDIGRSFYISSKQHEKVLKLMEKINHNVGVLYKSQKALERLDPRKRR